MSRGGGSGLETYQQSAFFDEILSPRGQPRKHARALVKLLGRFGIDGINELSAASSMAIKQMGITFTVYDDSTNIDREWPFDVVPRIIPVQDWAKVQAGLVQRVTALNRFIDDVYHDQDIFKDGVVPAALLEDSENYRPECRGANPAFGVWANITGTDLIRGEKGEFLVLEDNLRIPSGVSYMLENRRVSKRILAEIFENQKIQHVEEYPSQLHRTLASLSPRRRRRPEVVVMTPGIYNSAYFEHSLLAREMGCELVEGADLFVEKDKVYMKTIEGPERVDVIYRRVDDLFLDPEAFRPDSALGVPGLMRAWRAGNVAIANAPGCGVADDKVVYSYVPEMIQYYLGEKPLIKNVETWRCIDPAHREYVLNNLDQLVLKPANASGGYGILMGPQATRDERERYARQIKRNPRNFIAQPLISLSTVPIVTSKTLEPRHVDLRPFILQSNQTYVTPGGLTRVALRKGSFVVNSSQGGGSKDTWIVGEA